MALSIRVRSADASTPDLVLDLPRIVIGRSAGSEVRLPDPSVSQRHALIRQQGKDYLIIDEGSTNGTFVGPVRLSRGTPRVVQSGDQIRVGRIWLDITIDPTLPASDGHLTKELALRLVAGALDIDGQPSAPSVKVTAGVDVGSELVLKEFQHAYVLGRSPSSDLPVADPDASRRHLQFQRVGADILVEDLGSKNGSFIDEQPLSKRCRWKPGQIVGFGQTTLELVDPLALTLAEIEATADEVVDEDIPLPEDELDDEGDAPGVSPSARGAAGPVIAKPQTSRPPEKREKDNKATWGTVDVIVALVALAVIGISIAGILWLMRS